MDILVIGGTSFFGKEIVEQAIAEGHNVSIFSRGNSRPEFWDRVESITGDRTNIDDFARQLSNRRFDAVIDNIAYNQADVDGALRVFKGNIGRYVLTSSVAVYFGAGAFAQPFAESDALLNPHADLSFPSCPQPLPQGFVGYASGKIAAELALSQQKSVPFTIIRPPNVMGADDNLGRVQFYLQRLLDREPLILTDGGTQFFQPVYSEDLARSFVQVIGSKMAERQTYTIAQTKAFRLIDWLALCAQQLDVGFNPVAIPSEIIAKAGFVYPESWTYRAAMTFDVSKAVRDFGFQPTPVEEWTRTTAQRYLQIKQRDNSAGYGDRARELSFARAYRDAVSTFANAYVVEG